MVGSGADSEVEDSITEEVPHGLQGVHVIADHLDHHHHGHGEQRAPDAPDPAPEQQAAKIAMWFIDDARPMSDGVKSDPSSVVIRRATPATAAVMPIVPNCRKPTIERPP